MSGMLTCPAARDSASSFERAAMAAWDGLNTPGSGSSSSSCSLMSGPNSAITAASAARIIISACTEQ